MEKRNSIARLGVLREEKRTGTHEYWRVYAYDKAGNRLSKTVKDVTCGDPQFTTTYTYDVSDPLKYGSRGDRLMNQETRDAEDPENAVVEQRWYEYNKVIRDSHLFMASLGPRFATNHSTAKAFGKFSTNWPTPGRPTASWITSRRR